MSAFQERMAAFAEKAIANARRIHRGTVHAVFQSVVEGSPVTGAPGQPVGEDGSLKLSWRETITGDEGHVSTAHPAARVIESGTRQGRALVQRSPVGGFHSVALTVAGAGRLVEQVAKDGA